MNLRRESPPIIQSDDRVKNFGCGRVELCGFPQILSEKSLCCLSFSFFFFFGSIEKYKIFRSSLTYEMKLLGPRRLGREFLMGRYSGRTRASSPASLSLFLGRPRAGRVLRPTRCHRARESSVRGPWHGNLTPQGYRPLRQQSSPTVLPVQA